MNEETNLTLKGRGRDDAHAPGRGIEQPGLAKKKKKMHS